jgi:putative ABC transport system permease protein
MMTVNIRPVLSALSRNRTGALLVALEIALALAVMVNAAWIIAQRVQEIERPSGFDVRDTFAIGVAALTSRSDLAAAQAQDLAYLRALPGVVGASGTSSVPLTHYGQGTSFSREPGPTAPSVQVRTMQVDTSALAALGVHIVAGRNFSATDIQPLSRDMFPAAAQVLVTQSLAHELFPHGNALGRPIYDGDNTPMTIVGITSNFIPSVIDSPSYDAVLFPRTAGGYGVYFCLVRTQPGKTEALLQTAQRHLATSNPGRVVFLGDTLAYYRHRLDAENRDVVIFLSVVTALILSVTCLGIFGLTTFNVSTRTKQIGTMRAVGARKRDIVAHFLIENAIILSVGALAGCTLSLAVGYWLTDQYQLPRLDLRYLAIGVVGVAVIGQLAAWHPARRAAAVPPSVATRTV